MSQDPLRACTTCTRTTTGSSTTSSTENAAGAAVMFSKRIVLRDNVFARHVGYRAYGLLLHTGEEILAEGNRFEGNLTALFLDGSLRNTFRGQSHRRQRHRHRPARERRAEHLHRKRLS